ncbi:MAG: hypothetical protein HY747_05805 [Elusimicrobia bacterium]|nr:hypothetical protein [Elusimicrobiota bacterium]
MGLYKKGNIWPIDYYYQGQRMRESAGPLKTFAKDTGMDTYWTPRNFQGQKNDQNRLSIKEIGPVAQW